MAGRGCLQATGNASFFFRLEFHSPGPKIDKLDLGAVEGSGKELTFQGPCVPEISSFPLGKHRALFLTLPLRVTWERSFAPQSKGEAW